MTIISATYKILTYSSTKLHLSSTLAFVIVIGQSTSRNIHLLFKIHEHLYNLICPFQICWKHFQDHFESPLKPSIGHINDGLKLVVLFSADVTEWNNDGLLWHWKPYSGVSITGKCSTYLALWQCNTTFTHAFPKALLRPQAFTWYLSSHTRVAWRKFIFFILLDYLTLITKTANCKRQFS